MKQKLWLAIFLAFIGLPTVAQSLTQELQRFSMTIKNLTSMLEKVEKKEPTSPAVEGPDFTTWKSNCDKLPKYVKGTAPTSETALTFALFSNTLDQFFSATKPILSNPENWFNKTTPDVTAWDNNLDVPKWLKDNEVPLENMHYIPFEPFVPFIEKITFKTTDVIAFHGDFHGDIHAFNNFIQTWINEGYMDNNFKIIKDNFYIMFLGDYTDRGWYGAEVIYALLRLKLANLTHVHMVRGNHEDLSIIALYGFTEELSRKFTEKRDVLLNKITRFYNFLPMTIYISCPGIHGNDTIQCCHGGIEIGYNPTRFLSSNAQFAYVQKFMKGNGYNIIKNIAPGFETIMQNNVIPTAENGFMWSDFIVDPLEKLEKADRGEGIFAYGKEVTEKLFTAWSSDTHKLRAIFRAHQHVQSDKDPMKQVILNFNKTEPYSSLTASWYEAPEEDAGIAFLWSESAKDVGSLKNVLALTFSVAPATPYNWPYDAFGLLTLAEGYDNWHMKVYTAKRSQYEKK